MATSTWNGDTADWYTNNGGDWSPAGDPGPSSAVVINSGEAQLQSGDAAISVASISITGGLLAIQDPGVTQAVSGNVTISGSGELALDGGNIGGAGGSSLTIGGSLTNSSGNGNAISIGNTGITSADTLTVNGSGGLSNTGQIAIEGSATAQATLNVANAAAGFGTAGTETGNVYMQGDALLEFKSGEISTVDGGIQLNGADARIADAGSTGSNSALTGLTTVAGNFWLQNGATVNPTGNVSVIGSGELALDGGNIGGAGGSSLTIGGSLTNSSGNGNAISIGNTGITSADTLTVNGSGGLSNTGQIAIEGSATAQATLNVANAAAGFGTAGTETGNVYMQGDALLEFKSGEISTVDGGIQLNGADARIADAGSTGSNSALTGLTTVAGNFWLQNGATVNPTGNVSIIGNGELALDGGNIGGAGGSSLTIGGSLTNSSGNGNAISIGNTGITSADTLTVNGSGGLSNTGQIAIEGSATAQATLNVANAAAGFGTAGTETGNVYMQGDALLEFKSGEISTVDGGIQLNGADARIADAGSTGSNSALTGLTTVAGNFWLENGATVSTTGALSITGNGTVDLDGNNIGGGGGSSLTIGGTLTNSSTNGNGISIGTTGISSADTLTVNGTGGLSNTGEINIEGNASVQSTLNVANAAAGFGAAGVETGTVFLQNDALLEFKSGQIATVDGELYLDGANSRVADAGTLGSNSALTGLTSDAGNFWLANGATVSTTGALSITSNGTVDLDGNNIGGGGGSSLTIGGNLTNTSTNGNGVSIGTTGITSADTLTVNGTGGLSNTGEINIEGNASVQSTLNVANAAAGFGAAGVETGTVFLQNDALLEFKSGQITTVDGQLQLDGANSRVADAGTLTSNSALTGLTSVSGNFWLENGATVSTTGALSITGNATLDVDGNNIGGGGGSSLTIGGKLTNSSTNGNGVSVGNTGIVSADTLTVNGVGGISNGASSEIQIEGSASVQATLNVANAAAGFGAAGVETGTVFLQNDALLEFKSGEITTVDGTLWLDGAKARIADAGTTGSNSALTGLTGDAGNFWLENGATVTTTGALSITGNATLDVDGNNIGGGGGSSLTIGGKLTNSSTNGNGVSVGNTGIAAADTLTVNGVGGISNGASSEIQIEGSASVQATLNVANAAAGFGAAGVETGTVFLQNDALLEFRSGQIATVDGELWLDGPNSRVARAAAPATNSALTGLTTVSGDFWLENGAKVSPTGNVSVTGNGTVDLDGNNIGGGGGSSLTIGGTLTNSSTNGNGISIGTTGITSADTLTVKGTGGLSNSGDINIQGSASATATLDVTDTATSSGTIVIGAFGDLTATTVDITGGMLEGVGTVTGTLNDTGGTVVGGSFDGNTGTLTESGAYKQSGSGVLQTDINTGNSQQSSVISVTGTPGTPGAAGSVNLAGGTLLIDAETNLALNTPYTVMTFGADHLYGEFSQVETEGALGSFTGNGGSVNLGGGETLVVLYNEAAGDIQVELVATPSSTAYDWDTGSGTWNASSAADWNPPNNGTTPNQSSNVEIGTGSGGTVTLAADQTIASLTLSNGYTLSGAANSITATGNVSVASGAALSIDNMNVGGAFTDSGSATFAGVLTMTSGATFTLNGGTLTGGVNGAGTFETAGSGTLDNLTIYQGATYTASNGSTTDITGTIAGKGVLQVKGGAGSNGYLVLTGATTLSGGGAIELTTATGGGDAVLMGNGETLTNASDVIEGTGEVGNGSLKLINGGTIDANSSAGIGALILNGSGGTTNADGATGGLMEATSGGTLEIDGVAIDNLRGRITANGGNVDVVNATIEGGTLTTLAGGTMETSGTSTLNGKTEAALTISSGSVYTASNGATTDILGTISDKGTIQINGGAGNNGYLQLTGAATLNGGGAVSLTTATGGGQAYLMGNSQTLTNSDKIEGTGVVGNGSLTLINGGVINANSSAKTTTETLVLNGSGGVTNANGATAGLMEATSGGTLEIDGITVNNDTGAITANGGSVQVINATIQGGTLNTSDGGTMETASGATSTLDGSTHGALTLSAGSTYSTTDSNSTTDILGTIADKGTLQVNGGNGTNGFLILTAATTLNGGGAVSLTTATGGGNAYIEGNGETLTNADVIEGTGEIGNGSLAVINSGTIDANSSAGTGTLILNGSGGITNTNVIEATSGGTLQINSITVNDDTGAITANGGVVELNSATIQGGTLNTSGGGTMETASGANSTLDGSTHGALTISAGSTYIITDSNSTTDILGTIADDGTLQVNGGNGTNGFLNLTGATTLNGGGAVSLTTATGGGNAYIEGNGETLTNADVIEGTGTIGNGSLAVTNSGTIDANVSAGTLTLNGSGGLTNTGTFEATAGGHLDVAGALSGAGALEIGASSTVELGGATSENATFLSATAATLLIDNATTAGEYGGVLNSFAVGDILELGNTNATSATPTSYNGTDTTLTVDLSSGGPLTYTLAGDYLSDTFSVTHVGSNSEITDPAFNEAASLLGGHTAAPFVESSGVFGAASGAAAQPSLTAAHAHS